MPINLSWPTAQDKEVTDAIRAAIGRTVTFYYIASSSSCSEPDCYLDPVTNTSTNSFCPVCSGNYYIYTYSGEDINAHVTWGYSEKFGWVTGGLQDEGECRVQIEYTPNNVYVVENAKWVLVDGREMQIIKKLYRGVKEINRILVDLIQKE